MIFLFYFSCSRAISIISLAMRSAASGLEKALAFLENSVIFSLLPINRSISFFKIDSNL